MLDPIPPIITPRIFHLIFHIFWEQLLSCEYSYSMSENERSNKLVKLKSLSFTIEYLQSLKEDVKVPSVDQLGCDVITVVLLL